MSAIQQAAILAIFLIGVFVAMGALLYWRLFPWLHAVPIVYGLLTSFAYDGSVAPQAWKIGFISGLIFHMLAWLSLLDRDFRKMRSDVEKHYSGNRKADAPPVAVTSKFIVIPKTGGHASA